MLNRRHIRIKVMQVLYAFKRSEGEDFKADEKFLFKSMDSLYNLYLLLVSLLIEIQKKADDYTTKSKQKHLATQAEKNPNLKFVNNEVLQALANNQLLKDALEDYKITNWQLDDEYVDVLFKAIIKSDLYTEYMATKTSSFKDDKDFVVDMFKDIIAPNDKLYDYLEDKNLTWLDDYPLVNTAILKQLRKIKPESPERLFVPNLYKDEDDKAFAKKLFTKTLLGQSKINPEIAKRTKNWDAERIAQVDYVILQMAICELQNFPSIPTKVTINEYLEIAKEYSTPKSSVFINGVLDKLVKEYQTENKLNKIGRGLL